MRRLMLAAALLFPLSLCALLPLPQEWTKKEGRLCIAGALAVETSGVKDPRVDAALARFRSRAEKRMGRGSIPLTCGTPGGAPAPQFKVECQKEGLPVQGVREDESYTLEITPMAVSLSAPNALGVMHGLETLLQLLEKDPKGGWGFNACVIKDAPRFAWRGLLMDVSRHWMPVEVVKRNIDGLAAAKMNVLHWHLSEDQGFRVESKLYPKLQEMGSDGKFYTQDQVKEVVAYARERGVRVLPEFDMPGHVTAWLVGHPELGSAPGPYAIERKFGIFDPAFDPSRESTFQFLEGFLGEMAALFPDEYFHTGGDENNGKHWNMNPAIQRFMAEKGFKTNEDLQAYFSGRVSKILEKLGKKMVGWDEIMHTDLPQGTVVHAWRGTDSLKEASAKGYDTILSNGYYLDLQQPASFHYANDPAAASLSLTAEQLTHVLGGEACMWAELVDPASVDARIWPRNLAVAERLWSPANVQDVTDHYNRVQAVSAQMQELGLTHLSDYEPRLEALVGKKAAPDLKLLADNLSQIQRYRRHRSRVYLQDTPLDRLVDAVRAESAAAFWFRHRVDLFLSGQDKGKIIEDDMKAWAKRLPALKPVLLANEKTAEAAQLAQDQAELAEAGLLALANLRQGTNLFPVVYDDLIKQLARLAEPKAELELACLPAVKKLVLAMNSQDKKKELGAAEWTKWLDEELKSNKH